MRLVILVLFCVLGGGSDAADKVALEQRVVREKSGASAVTPASGLSAEQIIERYLAMPFPEEDQRGEARSTRLKCLHELHQMKAETPEAIAKTLPKVEDPRQRSELLEVLRRMHTPAAAAVSVKALDDPDASVRQSAIHALRMMSRKTNRMGGSRHVRAKALPEPVPGLVPHLIKAANDKEELNRWSALYALADTRDPAAVVELKKRLEDASEKVRLYAACFLTEYNDTTGLPVMRQALGRLQKQKPADAFDHYMQAEMLLASFERLTSKSFGEIPMNPGLLSDMREYPKTERQFAYLLDAWAAWWAWEPMQRNDERPEAGY